MRNLAEASNRTGLCERFQEVNGICVLIEIDSWELGSEHRHASISLFTH